MTTTRSTRPAFWTALAAVLSTAVAACSPASGGSPNPDADIQVAAGFYPLQFVAEQVGGDHVAVAALASPGVEPHDLELSPVGVRSVRDADVVLYLRGFQPSVDDAIASTGAHGLDAGDFFDALPSDHGGNSTMDPHFWLDPTMLAALAPGVAEEFAAIDPAHADEYRANAQALVENLDEMDVAYGERLAQCDRRTILVSHEAFGYLVGRYDLTQVGLSGIDPDAEPSIARVRDVRAIAEAQGATTVFVETLVDPSVVEAFARDAGLLVDTLDPAESAEAGDDYFAIMERNLDALTQGLGCG